MDGQSPLDSSKQLAHTSLHLTCLLCSGMKLTVVLLRRRWLMASMLFSLAGQARRLAVVGFTHPTTVAFSSVGRRRRSSLLRPITTTTTTITNHFGHQSRIRQHATVFEERAITLGQGSWARFASTETTQSDQEERDDHQNQNKKGKGSKTKKNKLQVKELTPDKVDKLMAAFDELARKDGFDSSMSYTADDATFEEDFEYDDGDLDNDDDELFELDGEFLDEDDEELDKDELDDLGSIFDRDSYSLRDFEVGGIAPNVRFRSAPKMANRLIIEDELADDVDDDDDILDFGGEDDDDMEDRIAQARRDMSRGSVTVPGDLDRFAEDATEENLRRLGFQPETERYGNTDEGSQRERVKLISDAMTCSACGSAFQARDERKPGYLPHEKFDVQVKLSKIEEMQQLKEKAESAEWSSEDEIEWLIQTQGKGTVGEDNEAGDAADIDVEKLAEEMGLDLAQLASKKVICKRCHGLQNFGKVDESLRPGWTEEPTLSQEQFRELLRPISAKPAVVIALIDLFDFSGSVLRELDGIAGDNPVIVAANKADLLPSQMGKQRAENWVRRELEYMGVSSLANVGGAVRLVSCKTGDGVIDMMKKARELAEVMDGDVYVVGAANAGKSTLINYILGKDQDKPVGKLRAGNRNAFKGALTTSPLPGTTLKFIKIDIGDGRSLYDTPGLLVPGTITQLLTPEELKIVCPKKKVEPITFRIASGKCVLVGGLAKIEVIGDSKPFLLTFFVANEIKLHPTDSSRAEEFVAKHAGDMLTPPLAPGPERMQEIGAFDYHTVEIEGAGWTEAAADITLTGLGWVAVTGAGRAQIRISVPPGIGVSVRPPLMPFDIWEVAAKYTGARAVRKTTKSKSGKRRKGVGRS